MIFDKKLLQQSITTADTHGLRVASGELLTALGVTSISVQGNLPPDGPLLIVSNHRSILDSMVLFSQTRRDDLYLIALSTYSVLGPQIQDRVLPIYRTRHLKHKLYEYTLCREVQVPRPENLTRPEILTRNRKTISDAAGMINAGAAVSMFPTGSAGKTPEGYEWKPGIGFLLKEITNPQARVIFVKITGTRKTDVAAYLRPSIRRLFFTPQSVTIHFSRSMTIDELVNPDEDGRIIARELEKKYSRQWSMPGN